MSSLTQTVVFRTDASLTIGSGHVMRCLTLADALRERGARCHFVCRELLGNLISLIKQRGHDVSTLPWPLEEVVDTSAKPGRLSPPSLPMLAHAHWLGEGVSQDVDACDTVAALNEFHGGSRIDWLIVDHYALDGSWEQSLRSTCRRLMAIDDLADRFHYCDLLLDQNLGRKGEDYAKIVPVQSTKLIGPRYALLRPEFARWRAYSLNRRTECPGLQRLLVTMGGVDKDNITGQVLEAIADNPLVDDVLVTVVMGVNAPWLQQVRRLAVTVPFFTEVLCGVSNMAQLMADSDLVIGAAGATAWERCCLGVPAIMLILAENQRGIGRALSAAGAAHLADMTALKGGLLITQQFMDHQKITHMSQAAAAVTDGLGVSRVIGHIIGEA